MDKYKDKKSKLQAMMGKLYSTIHKNYYIQTPKHAISLFLKKYPKEQDFIADNFLFITQKLYSKIQYENRRYRV